METEHPVWPQGFVEIQSPFTHIHKLVYAPPLSGEGDVRAYAERVAPLKTIIQSGAALTLFDYWLAHAVSERGIPTYSHNILLNLVDIAPWMTIRDRQPGEIKQRFRYFGEAVTDQSREFTGKSISVMTNRSDEEEWQNARHVYVDGRPGAALIDMAPSGRKYARHSICTVPFRGADSSEILYAVSAHTPVQSFGDPDPERGGE